jgi:hypothetical protein
MKKTKIYIAILILAVFAGGGCDFLSTRNPEAPETNNSGFVPPTSSDIVITNLVRAVSDLNVDDYIACFNEDDFTFEPAAEEYLQYQSIFSEWDLLSEKSYFNALISEKQDAGESKLTISELEKELIAGDSTVISAKYNWKIENIGIDSTGYSGELRWTMIRDESGLWSIKKWSDYRIENESNDDTWSLIKAVFSK